METFEEISLKPSLMQSLKALGYVKPSPIQAQALPVLLGPPTDFIGLAATGTGKTAAFAIPFIEQIDLNKKAVQALVLCPTRELALQVSDHINLLGKHSGIRSLPVYGGASYGDQIRGIKNGISIVVGTPGRMVDHIERGTIVLSNLKTVVFDEADEMVSMGFKEELETILKHTPRETCNFWFFTATMDKEVRKVAEEYLRSPELVQVNRTEMLSNTVEQIYYLTHEYDKPELLCRLIDAAEDFYGLIFCQTKSLVMDLHQLMLTKGYKVDCLHGDKSQAERERTMRSFRERKVSVLICTDVASRGLDVKDISHVINYSIPRELESYVHRIGRTARCGKAGLALSLVTRDHYYLISQIEQKTKSKMSEGVIPSRKDIGIKKVSHILSHFNDQKHFNHVQEKPQKLLFLFWC